MGQMNLAGTMTAIANALKNGGVVARAWDWPNSVVQRGQAVVGYPEAVEFDVTFGRGLERATFPVWVIAGLANEERTRDELSRLISGATDVKDALESASPGGVYSSLRVIDCRVETYDATPDAEKRTYYVSARFDCEVLS